MILLFGGRGFIGSHIRFRLNEIGKTEVVIVSRTGLLGNPLLPGEKWIQQDNFLTRDGDNVIDAASSIVYLASASIPPSFFEEPWRELSENVGPAFRSLHRVATRNPKAKIIYLSSGGTVYGDMPDLTPVGEDTPLAPKSPYGLGKQMTEAAVSYLSRTLGSPFNILRIANPVGVHARKAGQGIVLAALSASRDGVPLKVFGDGSNIRDYLDADDVADAVIAACQDRRHTNAIWNVGSGVGRSTMEILALVGQVTGRPVPFDVMPARNTDVCRIVLDSGRIKRDLGWQARRALSETIARMWATQAKSSGKFGELKA